jgi:hypothetical protein
MWTALIVGLDPGGERNAPVEGVSEVAAYAHSTSGVRMKHVQ